MNFETVSDFFSSTLGTVFYSIVVFGAGALVGQPLWKWIVSKLPFNKQ